MPWAGAGNGPATSLESPTRNGLKKTRDPEAFGGSARWGAGVAVRRDGLAAVAALAGRLGPRGPTSRSGRQRPQRPTQFVLRLKLALGPTHHPGPGPPTPRRLSGLFAPASARARGAGSPLPGARSS